MRHPFYSVELLLQSGCPARHNISQHPYILLGSCDWFLPIKCECKWCMALPEGGRLWNGRAFSFFFSPDAKGSEALGNGGGTTWKLPDPQIPVWRRADTHQHQLCSMSYYVSPLPSQGSICYSSCYCLIHSSGSNENIHARQLVHDRNSASVPNYYYCPLSRELDK